MTRRSLSLALALAAVFSLPPEAHAQINPGLHVARAADSFGGVNGVGGSLQLSLPVLPADLFLAGEYFFPNCDDCSFWGGSADVHFNLPVPIITPYGTAGLVLRNTDASDTKVRTGGLGLGAGLNLSTPVVGAYVEGRYELMDGSGDQLVFRLGLQF
ncbi:MAG: hypothetical protein ACREX3_05340 [Gammaproteobacteria bacterium]